MLPTWTACSSVAYDSVVMYTSEPACICSLKLCPFGDIYDRMRVALETHLDSMRISVAGRIAHAIRVMRLVAPK
jgi:hypothetical protein